MYVRYYLLVLWLLRTTSIMFIIIITRTSGRSACQKEACRSVRPELSQTTQANYLEGNAAMKPSGHFGTQDLKSAQKGGDPLQHPCVEILILSSTKGAWISFGNLAAASRTVDRLWLDIDSSLTLSLSLSLSLSRLSLCLYICTYVCICMCIYIYI